MCAAPGGCQRGRQYPAAWHRRTAQTGGAPPVEALLAFLEFCGKLRSWGYHSPFDEIMLDKAMRRHLGIAFKRSC